MNPNVVTIEVIKLATENGFHSPLRLNGFDNSWWAYSLSVLGFIKIGDSVIKVFAGIVLDEFGLLDGIQ